ncbi:MAG: hypothetical protein ACP5I1_06290, partial [Candidatus Hinthialibacter sp.]
LYTHTMASLRPQFGRPGERPQRGDGPQPGRNLSEEDRAKMEKAQEDLLAGVKEVLNDEQEKAWQEQTAKIEAELEAQRRQRGGFGGFGDRGGDRGGQRGGDRGGQGR